MVPDRFGAVHPTQILLAEDKADDVFHVREALRPLNARAL